MKTKIYWASQHLIQATHELHVYAQCWWLGQQVEFLAWRLRLEASILTVKPDSEVTSAGQGGCCAVHSMCWNLCERSVL